ncbi:hypothetical protein Tco_0441325 [Tanacetum coccineum]
MSHSNAVMGSRGSAFKPQQNITENMVIEMPDENQILLKVPRHHNMYSFDMKTPTPAKGFACLIAKATSDESKLWHRRLDKPIQGVGIEGMFDIDYLTDSMNYIPVSLENQANPHAGVSEVTNSAGTSHNPSFNASEEKDEDVELIVVPSTVRNTEEKAESRKSSTNSKKEELLTELQQEKKASSTDTLEDNPKIQAFRRELEEIALKHLGKVSENTTTSTTLVNTGSEPVNTGSFDTDDSPSQARKSFTNMEVQPTPTLRFKILPKSQNIGDPKSAVQTRSKVQHKSGAHTLLSHIQKQQRNNHKDNHILGSRMQEELLQFKLQTSMILVDHSWNEGNGTKSVSKTKDERGVVVRNKVRLVAQGYTQEEGQEHDVVAQSQPSASTPPVPSTSSPQPKKRISNNPKLTMGNAIVKLVKNVKLVKKVKKLEGFLKRRNIVLSESKEEEPEAQRRKSQDDPLDSLVQGLVTPSTSKVNASGEEQVEDINVNTGAEQVNTAEGVNTSSIKLSTGSEQVSTVSTKKSTPSPDKGQRAGKAPES